MPGLEHHAGRTPARLPRFQGCRPIRSGRGGSIVRGSKTSSAVAS